MIEPLITALLENKDPNIRTGAAKALGLLNNLLTIEPLLAALSDPHWEVRGYAAQSIGYYKISQALKSLIEALKIAHGKTIKQIVNALAGLGTPPSAQQPVPATAKDALQFAQPAAQNWASDAVLVLVGTVTEPGMFADGTADIWNFAFYSATKDSARNFFADGTRLIHQETPLGSLPSLQAIGTNWQDTDAVARITETSGGRLFRHGYQHTKVLALAGLGYNTSQPPDTRPNEKLWVVVSAAFEDSSQVPTALLRFELEAGSGILIPLQHVVTSNPPQGEAINFVNQGNDTLAVLTLTSGTPDSIAVEAFPGIRSDTTQNKKAVHRFYSITAYPQNAGLEATVTLYYQQEEFAASGLGDESALQLYRRKADKDWQFVGGAADSARNTVTVSNVTEFSLWAFVDPHSTIRELLL